MCLNAKIIPITRASYIVIAVSPETFLLFFGLEGKTVAAVGIRYSHSKDKFSSGL